MAKLGIWPIERKNSAQRILNYKKKVFKVTSGQSKLLYFSQNQENQGKSNSDYKSVSIIDLINFKNGIFILFYKFKIIFC